MQFCHYFFPLSRAVRLEEELPVALALPDGVVLQRRALKVAGGRRGRAGVAPDRVAALEKGD